MIPAILIPACESYSPTFHMMYSAYALNKQGDYTQPWRTPFPILNQSVDLIDCSLPGSSAHGILQARILEWVTIPVSRGISPTQGSKLGLLHCRPGKPWFTVYGKMWVCAHRSHSCDTHLSCLGPASWASSEAPSGRLQRLTTAWASVGGSSVSILSCLRAHCPVAEMCWRDGCSFLCLPLEQQHFSSQVDSCVFLYLFVW